MSMTCTVCRHPNRTEIEIAAVRGEAYRSIAERYDISATAAFRHCKDHLPKMLAASEEARDFACAETVLGQIEGLRDSALRILQRAEGDDSELALKALREARGCVELLARVIGELKDPGTVVNVLVMPEWVQVQNIILGALADHPQARIAVAGALKQLEAPHADAA